VLVVFGWYVNKIIFFIFVGEGGGGGGGRKHDYMQIQWPGRESLIPGQKV